MTGAGLLTTLLLLPLAVAPVSADAQPGAAATAQEPTTYRAGLWVVVGSTFATMRGGCQTCEENFPYRHAASLLADVGYRINPRTAVGAEVFWFNGRAGPVGTRDRS